MKKNHYIFLLPLLVLVFFGAGCQKTQTVNDVEQAESSTKNSNTVTAVPKVLESVVSINNFKFQPKDLIVDVGTTVIWKNNDKVSHNVVSKNNFESSVLKQGEEFRFIFTQAGVFDYLCTIHPSMTGKIIVK